MNDEISRLRYRVSNLNDELHGELSKFDREIRSRIETVHEESLCYEDLEVAVNELNQRVNHFFRAFARELRNFNGKK